MGFLIGNFFLTVGHFVDSVLGLYSWVVIASVVVSWLPVDRNHPVVRLLERLVEPLLTSLRRRFPVLVQGGLDLSPLVVLFAIQLIRSVATESLIEAGHRMR